MIDLQTSWPYVLGAVVLLALVILVLLLLLLRRSARRSELEVPDPGLHEDTPEGSETLEPPPGAPAPFAFRMAFSRAGRKLDKAASGDRHRVPLFLLLGSEGSREPDLLANAGLELPFGGPAEAGMDLGRGRGFWFLDRGVVLDLAGDMVLAADGRGSDEGSWRTALHLLQKMRPKRPMDGVILTVSCQELIDARGNDALRAALEDRAGRIYRKLWQMQQKLGFRTTVYVLVTGCERLPGFSGLCSAVPPRLHDEMLGWSSPYAADVAYRSAWAEEALAAFCSRVDDLQMEVFAERQTGGPAEATDADALFLLPASFRSLLELRSLLDQIFKPSAYHESLALRGIWFCGREGQLQPETQGARRTFFVKDLLNEKVFREAALARPTAQTVVARNRAVRIAQGLTAASLLLFAGGLLRGRYVLEHDATVLEKFLGQTLVDIRQVRQTRHEDMEDSQLRDAAHELLGGMSRIDFNRFGSVFIPSSWFSPFQGRVAQAISRAFEEVILQAIRNELDQEARTQIEEAGIHELSPVLSSGAAGAEALLPVEQMPEFLVFRQYVADMKELEKQGRAFNQLGQARDLKPLGDLVEYAFEESLPDSFFVDSHLYLAALRRARYEPFDPVQFRADASWRAEKLAANFYAALYRRSPLAARLEALALGLQVAAVQQPVAGETERFEDLVERIRDVETVLSTSSQEWAFRREFHLGADFAGVLAAMQSSQIFDPAAARRIRDAGASGWSAYQRYLVSVGSSITGPLLAVRDGQPEMQLSADTLLLQTALKAFLGQGFVASARSGSRIQVEVPPGARLAWDPVLLDQAAAATSAYERFREKGLAVLPADLRPAIDAVALDRTRSQTVDLVARAQRFESVPPAVSLSLLENEVRAGIGTFEASVRPVGDLVTALGRVQLEGPRRDVTTVMTSEAFRLLRSVDRLLEAEEPYRPRLGGFSWWDGSGPVSPAAWGGSDPANPAEVGVYLETTRSRIATLASSYSQPLLSWLSRAGIAEQPPEVRTLSGKWQGILDDLRDYEAKKPGNPVAVLEDYIANKMPTVETRNCAAAAAPSVLRPARSLFASSLYDISRQLSVRCYTLAGTRALDLYEETATYFNQRLAGRYPFSDRAPGPGVADADPDDIRAFFRLHDRSQAVIRGLPEGGAQGRPLRAARKFLDDMARVRAFFAPFLDAEKPEPLPSFDVEAAFRILREREVGANQIIGWALDVGGDRITDRDIPDPKQPKVRWTVGEPVRLSLRWASDGTRVPVVKARPGVSVRDRTVVYEYTNGWALLAAVADHRAPLRELPAYAETQPVTLALAVHTQPVDGGPPGEIPTQVFLRLTMLAPGTTQALDPPDFPSRAPMPDDPIVEDVL